MKNMRSGQYFALGLGIVFLLIGVMGFIPALVTEPKVSAEAANLGVTNGYGYLMGLFPINVLHNIVHITFGLAGILASISLGSARLYSRIVGLSYGVLVVMGLFPATSSTLGLIPKPQHHFELCFARFDWRLDCQCCGCNHSRKHHRADCGSAIASD